MIPEGIRVSFFQVCQINPNITDLTHTVDLPAQLMRILEYLYRLEYFLLTSY